MAGQDLIILIVQIIAALGVVICRLSRLTNKIAKRYNKSSIWSFTYSKTL